MLYVSLHRDDCFNRGVCDNCTRQCISCDTYEVLYVLIMPRASTVLLLVNACIIASERSGVEVRVRVILRAVGNFADVYLELRRTRYGDIQTNINIYRKIGPFRRLGQLARSQ